MMIIKNTGFATSTLNDKTNTLNWNVDYDGKIADIDLKMDGDDVHKKKINMKLDNNDLAKLLSVPSDKMSLDERLEYDFLVGNNNKDNGVNPFKHTLPYSLVDKSSKLNDQHNKYIIKLIKDASSLKKKKTKSKKTTKKKETKKKTTKKKESKKKTTKKKASKK